MMGPGSSPGHGGRSYRSFLGPVLVFPTIMRTRLFRLARIEPAPHRIAHPDQQHAGNRMHRGHSAASAFFTRRLSRSHNNAAPKNGHAAEDSAVPNAKNGRTHV